ncbi:MAG TPA: hypothetical protein VF066_09090 [Thermoleophilaceae bacterium]
MRPSIRHLLAVAAAVSAFAAVSAEAWAQDGTLVGLGDTTTLIGVLGGINLPQVDVPDGADPTATTPAQGGTTTTTTPEQPAAQPKETHALGYYCKGESKRHVHGQKKTPFSQCVSAMAKLSKGTTDSPKAACKGLSRRRVSGAKRTPYALCVDGGKKLLADKG